MTVQYTVYTCGGGQTCSHALFKCTVISIHFNILQWRTFGSQFWYCHIYSNHHSQNIESCLGHPLLATNGKQMLSHNTLIKHIWYVITKECLSTVMLSNCAQPPLVYMYMMSYVIHLYYTSSPIWDHYQCMCMYTRTDRQTDRQTYSLNIIITGQFSISGLYSRLSIL